MLVVTAARWTKGAKKWSEIFFFFIERLCLWVELVEVIAVSSLKQNVFCNSSIPLITSNRIAFNNKTFCFCWWLHLCHDEGGRELYDFKVRRGSVWQEIALEGHGRGRGQILKQEVLRAAYSPKWSYRETGTGSPRRWYRPSWIPRRPRAVSFGMQGNRFTGTVLFC